MVDSKQHTAGERWIVSNLFPVLSLAVILASIILGARAFSSGKYQHLIFAAFLFGLGAYMLSLIYQTKVGGATFVDRILNGFLITGGLFFFCGLSVLIFGWNKIDGSVPRSEGIEPSVTGIIFMLVAGVLKAAAKFMKKGRQPQKNAGQASSEGTRNVSPNDRLR